MADIPVDAERLDALDYIKLERMPSRLCPNAEQVKPVFTCPGCLKRSPQPTHLKPFACDCGLSAQIDGVSLYIWRAKVPA